MRSAALASAVLLVGCGGGDKEGVAAGGADSAAQESSTTVTIVTAPSTVPPTSTSLISGGRSPVSTTTAAPLADSMVTRDLIAESTLSFSPDLRPLVMNGKSYASALRLYSERTLAKVEIAAGRTRNTFLGVLGIPDDQKSASSHQVEISFDNAAPVYSVIVNFGEEKMISLDVTNVLRVRILVSSKTNDAGYVAIGNPRFT